MKNVLIVLMYMIGFSLYAQDSLAVTQENVSNAERIIDKYGGQAVRGFKDAVENITPLAEESFNMVVKLEIAKGIGMLLPLLMIIIIGIILPFVSKNSEWTDSGSAENGSAVIQILLWIAFIVLGIMAIFTTYEGILHLMAPEWFAIKEIIELVK